MTTLKVAFGRAVSRLRKERGFSQEEFAQKCGIGRTYMTGIEGGRHNVSLELIERITKGMKLDTAQLFAEVEREKKS